MKMKITITIKVTEEMEEWIIRLINKTYINYLTGSTGRNISRNVTQ